MKKIFKLGLLSISLILLTSGCMKINYDMEIKANKSFNFSALVAYLEEMASSGDVGYSKEDIEKFKSNGFSVTDYNENGYVGYKLFKNFKNIDDLSNTENVTENIEDFFEEKPQNTYFFKIDKGFLKNKYKASFDVTNMNTNMSDLNFNELEESNEISEETENIEITDENTTNTLENMDFTNMMSGMEAKFVVRLPYKSISNNATSVSKDGKTLTWDFITNQNINKIEFEFEIWDQKIIYIGIFLIVLLVIIIIVSIVNRPKKVITSEEEFQKELDISPMGSPEEFDDVLGTNMINK